MNCSTSGVIDASDLVARLAMVTIITPYGLKRRAVAVRYPWMAEMFHVVQVMNENNNRSHSKIAWSCTEKR